MKYSNTITLRSVTEKNSQQERPDTTSKWFDYECNGGLFGRHQVND